MKLNEDGTITLSQRETQEYVTKIISPKYKQLERIRKWQVHASTYDLKRIEDQLTTFNKRLDTYIREYGNNFPKRISKDIDDSLSALVWAVEQAGFPNNPYSEEAQEVEKAYNLYRMLLKRRRLIDEQT